MINSRSAPLRPGLAGPAVSFVALAPLVGVHSEMLLNSLYPPKQFREQLALDWNFPPGGNGFKIASKVLSRDPR
jgi:hypothetical protein